MAAIAGGLPATLFLFLAGISFALVTGKLVQKGLFLTMDGRTVYGSKPELVFAAEAYPPGDPERAVADYHKWRSK